MKADISYIEERSTVPGLSVDFKNMGGVSIRERTTTLEIDLRDVTFLLNGKESTVKEALKFDFRTQRRIHEGWKFATGIAQNFLFTESLDCKPGYAGIQDKKSHQQFSLNEKKGLLGHTNFEHLSLLNFIELDDRQTPTGRQLDGALKINGIFTRGLLGLGHFCTMKVTLSLCRNAAIEEDEMRDFLTQLKQRYFHHPLIFKKKLEANLRKRLSAAFLLSVLAVTPALILSIVPLLGGLGLTIPLIGLAGAGIALASFAALFGITTAAYALYYKLTKDQPKIKEVDIVLPELAPSRPASSTITATVDQPQADFVFHDFPHKKDKALAAQIKKQSTIMGLGIRLIAVITLSSAAVTPLLIITLIPLFSAMGLPTLAIAGIGAGISLATVGILFLASFSAQTLFNFALNILKSKSAQTRQEAIVPQPSIAGRAEPIAVQDPSNLNPILTASMAYRATSNGSDFPQNHFTTGESDSFDSEERPPSVANSISSSLA